VSRWQSNDREVERKRTGHFYFGENRTSVLWADIRASQGLGGKTGNAARRSYPLSGPVHDILEKSGCIEHIGEANLFPTVHQAVVSFGVGEPTVDITDSTAR
jgi:hypothetical protein